MSMIITAGDDRDDERDDDLDVTTDRDDDDDDRAGADVRGRGRKAGSNDGDERASDDDDSEPEGGWEAEAKRLRAALAKSNATGLRRRNQLRELRNAESKAADDQDDDHDDDEAEEKPAQKQRQGLDARQAQRLVDKAVKRKEAELQEQHRRDLIDTKAESALTRAGVSEKSIRLLKRELDYEELELLKDRSVDGLDEEIDRLKSEFPDLFRSGKSARRRINGGDDRTTERKKGPTTASQRQAAQLQGRG